jgi:hypothetical protein
MVKLEWIVVAGTAGGAQKQNDSGTGQACNANSRKQERDRGLITSWLVVIMTSTNARDLFSFYERCLHVLQTSHPPRPKHSPQACQYSPRANVTGSLSYSSLPPLPSHSQHCLRWAGPLQKEHWCLRPSDPLVPGVLVAGLLMFFLGWVFMLFHLQTPSAGLAIFGPAQSAWRSPTVAPKSFTCDVAEDGRSHQSNARPVFHTGPRPILSSSVGSPTVAGTVAGMLRGALVTTSTPDGGLSAMAFCIPDTIAHHSST